MVETHHLRLQKGEDVQHVLPVLLPSVADADLVHNAEMVPVLDVPKLLPETGVGGLQIEIETLGVAGMAGDLLRADVCPAVLRGAVIELVLASGVLNVGAVSL